MRDETAVDVRVEARTAGMVWKRELIRFARARVRIFTGLMQPLLFLFVMGYGLASLVGNQGGINYQQFMFPGVVAMSVVTTAMFTAMSIVWDREFGFLREMLVAPVSRAAIVFGKTLGGATVATFQGAVMLVLAPVVGVSLDAVVVLQVLGGAFLLAFALTSFGVFVASRLKRMESFQVVMTSLMMPMIFLSGAMFPLRDVPAWLDVLTHVDPLTYAVDPLRHFLFSSIALPPQVAARFGVGVSLFGTALDVGQELLIVAGFALVFLALSVRAFSKPE
jgi:ABC-2 type transport system permease protein